MTLSELYGNWPVASFFSNANFRALDKCMQLYEIGATISGNLISNLRFAVDNCLVATNNDDLKQLMMQSTQQVGLEGLV